MHSSFDRFFLSSRNVATTFFIDYRSILPLFLLIVTRNRWQ